jgi:16S rRNA (adenine1518-N6/adenine1519-N6)-dimethyltransferase
VWAAKVVAAIDPQAGDAFLEIGPGNGALTLPLAATGAPVLGVEIDRELAANLARHAPPNVTVLAADFLTTDVLPLLSGLEPQRAAAAQPAETPARRFRVVGNLPYYIASPILFRLLDLHRAHGFFADATVMVQREVADRLVARPGSKDYGVLTILLSCRPGRSPRRPRFARPSSGWNSDRRPCACVTRLRSNAWSRRCSVSGARRSQTR